MTDREKDAALVAEFRERAVVRELDRLQRLVEGLTARVAAQAELLGRKAERREM